MMPTCRVRTVDAMTHSGYLDRLRSVPAFRQCTRRQLREVARLVDVVEFPAGTVELEGRELVVTVDPVRALVVGRRALPAVLEMAPDLVTASEEKASPAAAGSSAAALRLHPA